MDDSEDTAAKEKSVTVEVEAEMEENEHSPPSKKTKLDSETSASKNEETDQDPPNQHQQDLDQDQGKGQQGEERNKRSKKKNKHIDPNVIEVRRKIQFACRDNDLISAVEAYKHAKSESIKIEAQSYYSLLSLCDGVSNSHNHHTDNSGGRRDNRANEGDNQQRQKQQQPETAQPKMTSEERMKFAFQVRDDMKSMKLPLNETAYSALVKVLSKQKEFDQAEAMLDEAEQTQQCKPKLRLYSSLLASYCESNEIRRVLQLWKRMVVTKNRLEQQRDTNSLTANNTSMDLTEREYNELMKCATSKHNPTVMELVLSELAEEVAVPAKQTVDTIMKWFQGASNDDIDVLPSEDDEDERCRQLVHELIVLQYGDDSSNNSDKQQQGKTSKSSPTKERPPIMGPVVFPDTVNNNGTGGGKYTWEIDSECHIDTKTGTLTDGCLKGLSLLPVPLSSRALEEMKAMNSAIVFDGNVAGNVCEFQGGRKGKKRKGGVNPNKREHDWRNFTNFLRRSEKGWDVVIDGANVGYYQQNFASAPKHVDYEKIDWVVQHFLRSPKKLKILLVMHTRHFTRDMLPQQDVPIVDEWRRQGILYQTPFGMNDDWFWMHAALEYRALVVTNDEMRDHHFQMLAPRYFLRWKERHQVHFDFGAWVRDVDDDHRQRDGRQHRPRRQVELEYPHVYSRRIQRIANGNGLVIPLPRPSPEDDQQYPNGGSAPSRDGREKETYLCVRMKSLE